MVRYLLTKRQVSETSFETLKTKAFHLMITDLNMPLREGEAENVNGGRSLIRNIYRL